MTTNHKYICIHGHFYQPPRENPWLETVECQESAAPYHDWNERITAECYGPNTASRTLDSKRRIVDIANNYSRISFNFGPTLLSWMEKAYPDIYRAILDADLKSRERYSGHGSALAQVYSHPIMPLANERDRRSQVIWGIADFESRFQRRPEGMWLSETAVDTPTLEALAEQGILFTILAPHQARRVRPLEGGDWESVEGGRVDPKMPYLCRLPSGKSISLFFYDGPPSQEIAFSNLLDNGEWFGRRLLNTFSGSSAPQLAHIATDGETYGHHRAHGDMALAACLRYIEKAGDVRLTVYGEFLEQYPPTREVEIVENSSWSCAHGVERWRSNCGCNSGLHRGWTQAWRRPLRDTLDWLRDSLTPVFEQGLSQLGFDPWRARDEYIGVILDRGEKNIEEFFRRGTSQKLSPSEQSAALKLLEMARHLMLMYTSCGWFFDDIAGLETVQIICYAARAIELAGGGLEEEFISRLAQAPGNVRHLEDGSRVYRKLVRPSRRLPESIGGQYGISSLFQDYPEESELYGYRVRQNWYDRTRAGKRVLAVGAITLTSLTTREETDLDFASLYLGDNTVVGGVQEVAGDRTAKDYGPQLKEAFLKSNLSAIIRLLDRHFPGRILGLDQLLPDERKKLIHRALEGTVREVESALHSLAEHHYPLIRALKEAGLSLPPALSWTVQCTINTELRETLKAEKLNISRLREAVAEAHKWDFRPDNGLLRGYAEKWLEEMVDRLRQTPEDSSRLTRLESFLRLVVSGPLQVSLWSAQNRYFQVGRELLSDMLHRQEAGDASAGRWVGHFYKLGRLLGVSVPLD